MSKRTQLATIHINGVISSDSDNNAERIIELIQDAISNRKTAAIALVINSPGGSPVQSKMIYDFIMANRDRMTFVTFIEDICASGGYYIASACDWIYANPLSLVGSVGVISAGFGLQDLISKIGIERRVHTAGKCKSKLDPYMELKDEDITWHKEIMEKMHDVFIADVIAGRKESLKEVDPTTTMNGEVFLGKDAVTHKLIDGCDRTLLTLNPDLTIKEYGKKSVFHKLLTKFGMSMYNSMVSSVLPKFL